MKKASRFQIFYNYGDKGPLAAACSEQRHRSTLPHLPHYHLDPSSSRLKSFESIMADASYEEQGQQEVVIESPRSVQNSPKSTADSNLSQNKGKKRERSDAFGPQPTNTETTSASSDIKIKPKLTFKDQKMHRLVFQKGGIPDGCVLFYVAHNEKLLSGHKLGGGIYCYCCEKVISPSQFEAHAGQASRKKPYGNIYVSNGVSLHQYAVFLKQNSECGEKKNDGICRACQKDGDLLPCDGCTRSFHKECVLKTSIRLECVGPNQKWFCKYCENAMKCVSGGRLSGVDQMEQIAKRCIRIVENTQKEDIVACALCRSCDFTETGFNDQTVIVCEQCEKEYHIGCLREHKKADLKELPAGDWFCCVECGRLLSVLKNVVACGSEKVPDPLMNIIKKKLNDSDSGSTSDLDVKWIVLHGKDVSDENRLFLAEAVDIFHECFDPIIDSVTGSDFIPSMVYGLKMGYSDFVGVHCALLMIGSEVITAGLFRVFGQDIAELPIVATRKANHGKGYFQLFFACFEKLLAYLNIKKIVLPAAEDAKSMWIEKFGFDGVTPKQLCEYRETQTSMVSFQGTSLLEKGVRTGQITFENGVNFSLDME